MLRIVFLVIALVISSGCSCLGYNGEEYLEKFLAFWDDQYRLIENMIFPEDPQGYLGLFPRMIPVDKRDGVLSSKIKREEYLEMLDEFLEK